MQILTQPQTEHHLPFAALLPALEQMFTTGCEVPLRHHHAIPGRSTDEDGILLLMPAWQTGQRLGVKTVSIFPGNARQGLPGLHSVYILYDARTG
ncbi:ornithine cyclodeaminase family protein, partial [Comamonas aquatica]|nr:ornithine cyclodeaminase family protein [Comamonas aquatica]